jgi:hypothetical protein
MELNILPHFISAIFIIFILVIAYKTIIGFIKGGEDLLSVSGHLGSEEPIVKPALVRSYYFKEVTIND